MIIDTHTHFYDPSRPEGVPWPPPENKLLYRTVLPADFQAVAAPHGVTTTIVVEASSWFADNDWILDLVANEPALIGLVGHIAPNRPEFATELARFTSNPRFCGMRCGGSYFGDVEAGTFLEDMATLAAAGLQLDVLVRREQFDELIKLANRVPTLRVVIDHIGHMPIDGNAIAPEWQAAYQQLAACPNIAMKVSALIEQSTIQPAPADPEFYRPTLDVLWNAFGAERVIYGSNWPVLERAGDYGKAFTIVDQYFREKGDAAYAKYFWENALAIYKVAR